MIIVLAENQIRYDFTIFKRFWNKFKNSWLIGDKMSDIECAKMVIYQIEF